MIFSAAPFNCVHEDSIVICNLTYLSCSTYNAMHQKHASILILKTFFFFRKKNPCQTHTHTLTKCGPIVLLSCCHMVFRPCSRARVHTQNSCEPPVKQSPSPSRHNHHQRADIQSLRDIIAHCILPTKGQLPWLPHLSHPRLNPKCKHTSCCFLWCVLLFLKSLVCYMHMYLSLLVSVISSLCISNMMSFQ